jgi:hypothetical protein
VGRAAEQERDISVPPGTTGEKGHVQGGWVLVNVFGVEVGVRERDCSNVSGGNMVVGGKRGR